MKLLSIVRFKFKKGSSHTIHKGLTNRLPSRKTEATFWDSYKNRGRHNKNENKEIQCRNAAGLVLDTEGLLSIFFFFFFAEHSHLSMQGKLCFSWEVQWEGSSIADRLAAWLLEGPSDYASQYWGVSLHTKRNFVVVTQHQQVYSTWNLLIMEPL